MLYVRQSVVVYHHNHKDHVVLPFPASWRVPAQVSSQVFVQRKLFAFSTSLVQNDTFMSKLLVQIGGEDIHHGAVQVHDHAQRRRRSHGPSA